MFYSTVGNVFFDRLGIAIADATFWLLIIGGICFSLWILFKTVIDYLTTDVDNSSNEE
jgi:hypothetical protein